jgi:hypothetical protein
MKKSIIVSLALAAALMALFAGCARIVTLAPPVTRSYDLAGFSTVEVGHTSEFIQIGKPINIPVEVTLTQADAYQVSVTANENIFGDIAVSKDGTALKVVINRLKIGNPDATVQVQIAAPTLAGVKTDGLDMTATVVGSAPIFDAEASGAGQLDITLQAEQATLVAPLRAALRRTGRSRATPRRLTAPATSPQTFRPTRPHCGSLRPAAPR